MQERIFMAASVLCGAGAIIACCVIAIGMCE